MDKGSHYNGIEEVIEDLKHRESQLRCSFEKELTNEKLRSQEQLQDINEEKERYAQLKQRLKDKSSKLEQEVIDLKDCIDGKERELRKSQRECDKWKREVTILKEEMSLQEPSRKSSEAAAVSRKVTKSKYYSPQR